MATPTNKWPADSETPTPNLVLRGSEDTIPDLLVHKTDDVMISCWEFTDEEIATIIRTGRVYLGVMGQFHPPVALSPNAMELFPYEPGEGIDPNACGETLES